MHSRSVLQGFTLIEVTLSIVIGIILIAGATLLYNQAKIGAGNTRAKAKSVALQSLVEEFLASSGNYPDGTTAGLYNAWVQRHPDDFNMSPWGGPAGAPTGGWLFVRQGYVSTAEPAMVRTTNFWGPPNTNAVGCIWYEQASPSATGSLGDFSAGAQIPYRNYAVGFNGQDGSYWWFVQGGK